MVTTPQLLATMTALETTAGASTAGNDSYTGRWKRIAAAAETIAGATSTANDNMLGYMLRAAVALEAAAATSTPAANGKESGLLLRIVNALEAKSSVGTGSIGNRLVASAQTAVFSSAAAPTFASATGYGPSSSSISFTPFAGLDLSAYKAAIFIAARSGSGGTPLTVGALSTPGWAVSASGADGTTVVSAVYYRTAPGALETLQVASGGTVGIWSGWLILISHTNAVQIVIAVSTPGANPCNPPLVDTLASRNFLAVAAAITRTATAFTAAPAGYSNLNDNPGAFTTAHAAFATKTIAAAQTEDPGTFTGGATGNKPAFTIALYE